MILYQPLKAIALVLLINENGRYNFCCVDLEMGFHCCSSLYLSLLTMHCTPSFNYYGPPKVKVLKTQNKAIVYSAIHGPSSGQSMQWKVILANISRSAG